MVVKISKRNANIFLTVLIISGIIVWRRKRVIWYARKFLGLKEISGNMGFENPVFQEKMENVGWKKGDAWCVYFVKVIWIDKYKQIKDLLAKLIVGNSQRTLYNFVHDDSELFEITSTPKIGAIAIWTRYDRYGKKLYRGHAGIVTKISGNKFYTIEGNTTSGKDSDDTNDADIGVGYIIDEKEHKFSEFNKTTGLKLVGFIVYKYSDV